MVSFNSVCGVSAGGADGAEGGGTEGDVGGTFGLFSSDAGKAQLEIKNAIKIVPTIITFRAIILLPTEYKRKGRLLV